MLELKTYKNYKELCVAMKWKITGGSSKKSQFKELSRYCNWHKEGNKIIIDNIFDSVKEKIDMRKYNKNSNRKGKFKTYYQFNINQEQFNNKGIYYILNKETKEIYIGSTIAGFRTRFQKHYMGYDKSMKHTYDLLHSGGEFNILYDMTNIIDEELIRMVENEYIQYFKHYTDYNVINHKNEAYSVKNKKENIKYKSLRNVKVKEEDYYFAISLLKQYGLIN